MSNTTRHILSKSTFMYGCQCPLRLYKHKFEPQDRNPEDEAQQAIFNTGTNIGLLAHQLFPGGSNAEPPDAYSYHIAVEKTKKLIENGTEIIYEACFRFNGILCALDILVKNNSKWYAFEVKGTNSVKEPHIKDTALQYYVITNCGLALEDISIVHLNRDYVRIGDLDVQQLFAKTSVLQAVLQQQSYIHSQAELLLDLLAKKSKPTIEPGEQCFAPYECDFTQHCWRNVEPEPVEQAAPYFNKRYVEQFIDQLQYPLYFLDFETIMPAVPEFDYSRPYQQLPFQYSLHVLREKNGPLEHIEFLGDGLNDPRKALMTKLVQDLGDTGNILVWYQPFENSRIREMGRDFPEFQAATEAILKRVVDLMVPFKSKQIVRPEFEGSASIKKVLPAMVPELSYKDLVVQEGGTASAMYYELKNQSPTVAEEHRKHLLAYCKMDTEAMVRILGRMMEGE